MPHLHLGGAFCKMIDGMEEIINKTDGEIVDLVRKNNKEMYSHIIKRYQEKLIRYSMFLIGDYDKASDAVQEAFIKAYINLNGFNVNKKILQLDIQNSS